ncbi:MAG: 3-hydroxyisobutyryl-CoA hydrolase, partial [Sulfitobacter sp.]
MSDINIRVSGRAGRITLTRPHALNAMTYDMCMAIDAALQAWENDDAVSLIVIDAEGDRAFCSGGDIAELYETGKKGDFAYGQKFWADEYRLNNRIFNYAKPVVSFLQGFTMGGGVGIGCHGSHRIVGDSSQIAMPECGIGLVPDVGGSLMLALAPGRLGEYLGTTGTRMGPEDAIYAGFADTYVSEEHWPALIEKLEQDGDVTAIEATKRIPPSGTLHSQIDLINTLFGGETLGDILTDLRNDGGAFAKEALKKLQRASPLSMACTIEIIHRLRGPSLTLAKALDLEYRFTYRASEHGDFVEGIRAAIIDKDRTPRWQFADMKVPVAAVSKMLQPLGKNALNLEETAMTSLTIGFIGLGNMGAPMAANLAKAGHNVRGYDVAGTTAEGVAAVADIASAATGADVVITMLPNGSILRQVAVQAIEHMAKGSLLIDCSTVDVESARNTSEAAEDAGILSVDAPVSGGIGGASAGTLTFMAGGSEAAFSRAAPLFDIMGQKAVHCGDAGAGQAAKICNNMILGVTMVATCEAFA